MTFDPFLKTMVDFNSIYGNVKKRALAKAQGPPLGYATLGRTHELPHILPILQGEALQELISNNSALAMKERSLVRLS